MTIKGYTTVVQLKNDVEKELFKKIVFGLFVLFWFVIGQIIKSEKIQNLNKAETICVKEA